MLTSRFRDGRADSRLALSVREGEGGDVACGLIEMRAGGQYLLELEPLFVIEVGWSASVPKLPRWLGLAGGPIRSVRPPGRLLPWWFGRWFGYPSGAIL